jgi:2-oxoglutarate ferredoxin oxidoreductase subunit delta
VVIEQTAKRWQTSKGTITLIDTLCKGCGWCIEYCPVDALAESDEFNLHGYYYPVLIDPDGCVNCGYCQLICPDFAIWSDKEVQDL